MATLKRLKTITSHTGLARFLAETEDLDEWLARCQVDDIPSPYAYSPTKTILKWGDRKVIYFETKHRRYEVFEVPAGMRRFASDEAATDWHIANSYRRNG